MKIQPFLALAGVSCLTAGLGIAQDECASAVPAAYGANAFNTSTATLSLEAWSCAASTSPDLWFTYTAVANFNLVVNSCGSTFDTMLMVYSGTCGTLLEVACNDDVCGTGSSVAFVPTAGTLYYIRVGGFGAGAAGPGTLNVLEQLTVLPNDECIFAQPVVGGTTLTNTAMATTSTQPWSCSSTSTLTHGRDLWFAYTPANSGDFTINTCNPGTTFDTVVEVFTGSCGMLNVVGCNDDVTCAFGSFRSAVTLCGLAGTTYTFRVGSYAGAASGAVEFNIVEAPPVPNCVATTFVANNGGSVGGMVYFNATFTQPVILGGLNTNTSIAVGTALNANVYVTPNTYVGVTGNMAAWTLVASGSGIAAAANTPSAINFNAPLVIPAGTYGVAIHAVNFNHRYTNGIGTNQAFMSPNGVVALALGVASNTAFAASPFANRVWNGSFCYDLNIGTVYCTSNPNSTGSVGRLIVGGTNCVVLNSLVLTATNLPQNSFGYFLCSTTPGSSTPANSQGVLCLGGDIGRGVGGAIYNSGVLGVIRTTSSLTLPHPSLGTVQVMPGQTWHYQAWHRDVVASAATSNLTEAVSVTYH